MRPPLPRSEPLVAAAVLIAAALLVVAVPALVGAAHLAGALAGWAAVAVAGVGMASLLARGQIDLSVGEQIAIAAALTGTLVARGVPVALAEVTAVSVGALLGAINGALVGRLGIPSALATFGSAFLFAEGWRWLGGLWPVRPLPPASLWGGLRPSIGAALAVAATLAVLAGGQWALRRDWRAVRARVAGRFALMGALAALAGVIAALGTPAVPRATGLLLAVLAAALVAGAGLPGTRLPMLVMVAGAALVTAVTGALPLVPRLARWSHLGEPLLLLAALGADALLRRVHALPPRTLDDDRSPPVAGSEQARLVRLAILVGGQVAVLGVLGRNFVSLSNFAELARLTTEIALVALPAAWIIAGGGLDLSVPGLMGLCAVTLSLAHRPAGLTAWAAVAMVLALGTAVGSLHGVLMAGLRLPPALVTAAGGALLGVVAEALAARPRPPVGLIPPTLARFVQHLLFGLVPRPLVALALVTAAFHLVRRRGARGRARHGSALVYGVSGLLAAAAAVLVAGQRGVARPDAGALFALWAIAAALVGGAARREGPSVAGTLLGSLAVAVLVNGLPLADVSIPAVTLAVAALLLASLRGSAAPGRAGERRGQPAGAVPKQSLS